MRSHSTLAISEDSRNDVATMVQHSLDLHPTTPGSSISGTVLGNDQILCGNVKSSHYIVTPMNDLVYPLRERGSL
jgi:hypothetical protein